MAATRLELEVFDDMTDSNGPSVCPSHLDLEGNVTAESAGLDGDLFAVHAKSHYRPQGSKEVALIPAC
jgi:hypothetical protein